MIGGGAGGYVLTFPPGFHSKERWTTSPGREISSSALSAARNTASCRDASPGMPKVSPKGCSMAATRGAPVLAVSSGIIESETVLKPTASISRCTSPTDQQQTGQTGTSTTTSTCSSRSRRRMAGTLSRSRAPGRIV